MGAIDNRYAALPGPAHFHGEPGAVIDLRGIGRTMLRRWLWIVAPMLLVGCAALGLALSLVPRYESSAKVLIDPRGLQVFQNDLRPANTTGDETAAEVESQVQVIASTSVLSKVAERLKLAGDPEFARPQAPLPQRIMAALTAFVAGPPEASAESPAQTVLRTLQNSITVRRSEKTFILDISVSTQSPEKSARIANAVGDAFLDESNAVRSEAARRSGAALGGRLDELQKRLQRSEAAVEAYRARNDLINANGRLVSEQQLADLNNQLTLARTRAAEQESRVAAVRRAAQAGASADTLAEVAVSPTVAALRGQYADAARIEAEARLTYGPRHPAMAAAQQQVDSARRRISEEVGRLARTAESDADRARASEAGLAKRIEALKKESGAANQSQVRLRELERQATADRTVYESFLNRSKDLQERQTLDTGGARVITPAVPPIGRTGLSKIVIIAAGLLFGGAMGAGLALLREQFDGTIRSGRQVTQETRLPVLATLRGAKADDSALWRLRDLLTPGGQGEPGRMVLIAGLGAPAARAGVAQGLARIVNSGGESALLVDGDSGARAITRSLKAERNPGLTDLLAASPPAPQNALRLFNGLRVITAGTLAAGEAQASVAGLRAALSPFLRQAGLIVVDGGAIGPALRAFSAMADDIVLVVEGGRVALVELHEAIAALGPDSGRIRGVVLAGSAEA